MVLFLPVYGILAWNAYSLRKSRNVSYNSTRINEDKYFELKYKLEYIVVIFAVIAASAGILGYNWQTVIKKEINDTESHVKGLNDSLQITQEKLADYQRVFSYLDSGSSTIGNRINSQSGTMNLIKKRLDEIESKDIIKQITYIALYEIPVKNIDEDRRIYLKELTTITGKKLPQFNKRPIITILSNDGVFHIDSLTNDYIKISTSEYYTAHKTAAELNISITAVQ